MIDPEEGERAEINYRSDPNRREKLKQSILFLQEALRVLDLKRRYEEQVHHATTLGSADQVSIRLHSMKIGREQLLDDLWALTKPIEPTPQPIPADYKSENDLV